MSARVADGDHGHADVAIVGAGAAGLMAATAAGRAARAAGRRLRIVLLDGAARPGAKILVAGGGRCNVTHDVVDEGDFCGSTPPAIRKVLRRFGVADTVAFFAGEGVALKTEPGGKLFPVTDRARTVLDALLGAARAGGAEMLWARRVETVLRTERGFEIAGPWGRLAARRVVLATGGMSLPKSGSDGHGYRLARALGHALTPRLLPALVPLLLEPGAPLLALAGVSTPVVLTVCGPRGNRRAACTGPLLVTHVGVSGPAVLDVSRHLLDARADDPAARLLAHWLPGETPEDVDRALRGPHPGRAVRERLTERLAAVLAGLAGVDLARPGGLERDARRRLVNVLTAYELPVRGHRGFAHAEVTAGGVPLAELRLDTLESRVAPGLHLCGEICDVDGRIGGFNFQWAWASGFVAGSAAAACPEASGA